MSERPHLIAPEPRLPRRRRVAAPGEPSGRRPGTVEGHEKECPRPGGGTPAGSRHPCRLCCFYGTRGGGERGRRRNTEKKRVPRWVLAAAEGQKANLGRAERAVRGRRLASPAAEGSVLRVGRDPSAPRCPLNRGWRRRRCAPLGRLPGSGRLLGAVAPAGDGSRPWARGSAGGRAGPSAAACAGGPEGRRPPRRRASLLWEWVSSGADPPLPCGPPARREEGGGSERALTGPLAPRCQPAVP